MGPARSRGLILATEPIWILLLARLSLAEHVSRPSWTGAAAATGGIAILAGPAALSPSTGPRALAGIGLVALGTACFGANTIVLRPLSRTCGPVPATAASTVVGTALQLAFAGSLSSHHLELLPPAAQAELSFLALGSTAAGKPS